MYRPSTHGPRVSQSRWWGPEFPSWYEGDGESAVGVGFEGEFDLGFGPAGGVADGPFLDEWVAEVDTSIDHDYSCLNEYPRAVSIERTCSMRMMHLTV